MLRASTILVTIFLVLAVTAANEHSSVEKFPPLRTPDKIDLSRYLGTWYVISAIPEISEYKCVNTKATYTAEKGHIFMHNQCNRNSFDGKLIVDDAIAYPTKENNARWRL
jgi:apolipoprotein D and lipocalin family protein